MLNLDREYEEYFGGHSIVISKPNELIPIFTFKKANIHAILSSNFEDLYLIHMGDETEFSLPENVDIKYETNLAPNDYKLIRNYTLVLNSYNPKTLIFAERNFPIMSTSYIILIKEYTIDFQDFDTGIRTFDEAENAKPIFESIRPAHVYFGFEKETFMEAWNRVHLGTIEHNSLMREFRYPLLEKKQYLPRITILKPFVVGSPPIHRSEATKMTHLGLLAPLLENKNNKQIDTSNLRPTPTLPHPIISPSEVQKKEEDSPDSGRKPTFNFTSDQPSASFARSSFKQQPPNSESNSLLPKFLRSSKKPY